MCTHGDKPLSNEARARVPGPALLSVADAEADEGGILSFAVRLSRAAGDAVTVDYATADGTAAAGEDYAAAAGTLTFAAGETSKTVEVEAHADRAAEGDETFTLALSNASGAPIDDGEATGAVADVAPPAVSNVAVVSDPGEDDTYRAGDAIRVRVTFNEAEAVDASGGNPRLQIDMDPADWGEKWALYESGSGTAELTFAYTVAEPNESTQGVAVLADTLELNGGTIESASSRLDADLAHDGLDHDPEHKVDWRPAPATVAVVSDAGEDDTYAAGDVIRVRVTFGEVVDVTGSPRLKIKMDPDYGEKWALYEERLGDGGVDLRLHRGGAERVDPGRRGAGEHTGAERRHDPVRGDAGERRAGPRGSRPRSGAQGGLAMDRGHHAAHGQQRRSGRRHGDSDLRRRSRSRELGGYAALLLVDLGNRRGPASLSGLGQRQDRDVGDRYPGGRRADDHGELRAVTSPQGHRRQHGGGLQCDGYEPDPVADA